MAMFLLGLYVGGVLCMLLCTAGELSRVSWGYHWWFILWQLTLYALIWPVIGVSLYFDDSLDDETE